MFSVCAGGCHINYRLRVYLSGRRQRSG
jgi:hypothetical protein